MESDDPFAFGDKTMMRPVPGGRSRDLREKQASSPSSDLSDEFQGELNKLGSLNPIEKSASALLLLLTRLSEFQSQDKVAALKVRLISEIKSFQMDMQVSGVNQEMAQTARYLMCTVLDEAVLNTPWGSNSDWAQRSLLSQFHQEVSGGERFFQLMESLGKSPQKNLHLLELMYLCLAFGFEGRFRVVEGGRDKLRNIREWLYQVILRERGRATAALSPHWMGITDKRHPLIRFVPMWVLALLTLVLLTVVYSGFWFSLSDLSSPLIQQVSKLESKVSDLELVQAESIMGHSLDSQYETLKKFLSQEINTNQVTLEKTKKKIKITLKGDGLFSSGQARVKKNKKFIIATLGDALEQTEGKVNVIGHTDSIPMNSLKFPSNFDLSLARAQSVGKLISKKMTNGQRVVMQGKADWEPVAENNSAAGRRKNRRVEIILR